MSTVIVSNTPPSLITSIAPTYDVQNTYRFSNDVSKHYRNAPVQFKQKVFMLKNGRLIEEHVLTENETTPIINQIDISEDAANKMAEYINSFSCEQLSITSCFVNLTNILIVFTIGKQINDYSSFPAKALTFINGRNVFQHAMGMLTITFENSHKLFMSNDWINLLDLLMKTNCYLNRHTLWITDSPCNFESVQLLNIPNELIDFIELNIFKEVSWKQLTQPLDMSCYEIVQYIKGDFINNECYIESIRSTVEIALKFNDYNQRMKLVTINEKLYSVACIVIKGHSLNNYTFKIALSLNPLHPEPCCFYRQSVMFNRISNAIPFYVLTMYYGESTEYTFNTHEFIQTNMNELDSYKLYEMYYSMIIEAIETLNVSIPHITISKEMYNETSIMKIDELPCLNEESTIFWASNEINKTVYRWEVTKHVETMCERFQRLKTVPDTQITKYIGYTDHYFLNDKFEFCTKPQITKSGNTREFIITYGICGSKSITYVERRQNTVVASRTETYNTPRQNQQPDQITHIYPSGRHHVQVKTEPVKYTRPQVITAWKGVRSSTTGGPAVAILEIPRDALMDTGDHAKYRVNKCTVKAIYDLTNLNKYKCQYHGCNKLADVETNEYQYFCNRHCLSSTNARRILNIDELLARGEISEINEAVNCVHRSVRFRYYKNQSIFESGFGMRSESCGVGIHVFLDPVYLHSYCFNSQGVDMTNVVPVLTNHAGNNRQFRQITNNAVTNVVTSTPTNAITSTPTNVVTSTPTNVVTSTPTRSATIFDGVTNTRHDIPVELAIEVSIDTRNTVTPAEAATYPDTFEETTNEIRPEETRLSEPTNPTNTIEQDELTDSKQVAEDPIN
jgi:hypothetical protein